MWEDDGYSEDDVGYYSEDEDQGLVDLHNNYKHRKGRKAKIKKSSYLYHVNFLNGGICVCQGTKKREKLWKDKEGFLAA